MANTVQLTQDGNIVYPITDVSCVMGLDEGAITEAVLCWDGASTPVVANIPAGVVVTYNSTTYTGTLAASADTVGKIYMVATGTSNNYDRYMTFAGSPSYVWKNIGDTTIDLSSYATKAEVGELEAKVDTIIDTESYTSPNLFDKAAATADRGIWAADGAADRCVGYYASDFIPIPSDASYMLLINNSIYGNFAGAVYNSSKTYIRRFVATSGTPGEVTPSEGEAYIRFTIIAANIDTAMCVVGTVAPQEYVPYGEITKYTVKDDTIGFDAISFKATVAGKNKLNPEEVEANKYVNRETGDLGSWDGLSATGFIPVSKRGLFFNKAEWSGMVVGGAVYDSTKEYIRPTTGTYIYEDGDGYVRFSFQSADLSTAQVEEGSVATSYEPFASREVIDPNYLPEADIVSNDSEINVVLPKKIFAVVGDTLQVFFKQIIQAVKPLNYNVLVSCSRGSQYHRYFEYTPVVGDVGEVPFVIYVKNDEGEIVGSGECTLVTVASPSSPSTQKNILCIGDSLTANGKWPAEAYRRLTGTGGTPSGKGLSNIAFVGSMNKDGAGFLGKSGWSWRDYCTEGRPAFRFTVGTGVVVNIDSVYSNNSHNYTVIEVSDNGTILCATSSASNTPQSSGILTLVSGSGDLSLSYSSVSADSQNPLWDGTKLTFVPYVNTYCGGQIDSVYVLLGGNGLSNWKTDFSEYLGYIEDFADTLHAEYPSAKMVLLGMQFPSMELMMPNYGASGNSWADTYGMLVSIARLRDVYKDFAERDEYNTFVSYVDVGSQFDGDYNYYMLEKAVNTRNTTIVEPYDGNALHPADAGYMQYADAVYRAICAELS